MQIKDRDYLLFVLGVVMISFSPLAVKLVSFDSTTSAFYRSFYAAIFLLILSLWKTKKEQTKKLTWVIPSVVAGVFLGADLIVWHKTIILLGAGIATFLGNSQILFITPFAALVFKEKIPKIFYLILAIVLFGLFLIAPATQEGTNHEYGYILGLIVGLTYAGMLISLRYAKTLTGETYPELLSLFVVFVASATTIALYSLTIEQGSLLIWDIKSHILIAGTALLCQAIGWSLINYNLTKIPAHEGSLTLMLQPILATIWGAIIFNEYLSILQIIGIVITVTGITAYHTKYHQTTKKTLKE